MKNKLTDEYEELCSHRLSWTKDIRLSRGEYGFDLRWECQ